jgi:DNA adenine methylase
VATTPGPFLRWAGGKRQLLPEILKRRPQTFSTYYEPFLGGGAVLFALDLAGRPAVVNDVNEELTVTYTVIRDDVETLIVKLEALAKDITETGFKRVRSSAPTSDVDRAARLIYLNRTCFNGLYRVNSSGGFNVPWGKLKNPTVCNQDLLRAVSGYLAGVQIHNGSFKDAVKDANAGDFVYLDPPYIPLTPTSSFSKYAKADFREPDQRELAQVMRDLSKRGVYVMMSNSDTPLSQQIFTLPGFTVDAVTVSRSISASSASRGRVGEILVYNYDPQAGSPPPTP